jgi:hypothetical protein
MSAPVPPQEALCERLQELCRAARVVQVPACAPPDRDRLELWSAVWPVCLRKRPAEPRVLQASEKARMERCIQLALRHCGAADAPAIAGSCPCSGAVLVDPAAAAVLAVAGPDFTSATARRGAATAARHPLEHASMRLIAELASQGAYLHLRRWQQRASRTS